MTAVIEVAAPPEVPRAASSGPLALLVPLALAVATLGVTAVTYLSGSVRSPTLLAFPAMMLASTVVTALAGLGRRRRAGIDADRVDYLHYLSGLRGTVTEVAAKQHSSLVRAHPDPETLWTLAGGPSMWRRAAADPDFCAVRVGTGTVPLAARLVASPTAPAPRWDPVTAGAFRRFLRTQSTIADAPIVIFLRAGERATVDGDAARVRGLLRAMVCQLAVLNPPDELLIAGAVSTRNLIHWDWLKWLPHNQHPDAVDLAGSARMVYRTCSEAQGALGGLAAQVVLIVDVDDNHDGAISGVRTLAVGDCHDGPLVIRRSGATESLLCPDRLDPVAALVCARRLAAHQSSDRCDGGEGGASVLGLGSAGRFDPVRLWRKQNRRDRLCVPIGVTCDGTPVELDIKEAAEQGMGPHGLCIGATGSGKSELLRTIALGMMARNSPAVLNLLLVDFKGGATFLDFEKAPHVAAVITNLADDVPLVARMRDALAGEMNRRQQLLRRAGNVVSVAAYEAARGPETAPLPTLFVIVDEFSELLSQHPEFIDMFVAIGRLGRSLGMHLLLASQRFDEGRLRGLEANLSYRVCLKTLSGSESRAVLGVLDAYELPNTPGAGILQTAAGNPIRFQAARVSRPLPTRRPPPAAETAATAKSAVRRFTAEPAGAVISPGATETSGPDLLHTVLDAMAGHGPAAHRVWLPPLDTAPRLGALLPEGAPLDLTVPIGLVDRPYEQSRTPLVLDLSDAAGNVAVVGAPRSGKSTTLCTVITALAATHDPGRVQFYCLDFGGGMLAAVRDMPHVGVVADRAQPALVRRVVAEMESYVRAREGVRREHGAGRVPDVFLVVDGWASLCHEFDGLEAPITAIAAQGLSFGVHVMLSASRWAEIRPALKDQIGTRVELRLGDPADSEADRKVARQVPRDRPGRGLSQDGLHMMIAVPHLGDVALRRGETAAPPIPLLPNRVDYQHIAACGAPGMLLGLDEHRLGPVAVDFAQHQHLLVLGDRGCGKTATLRTLCREVARTRTAAQARLFVVDFRRTLLGAVPPGYLDGHVVTPAALSTTVRNLVEVLRGRMPPADVTHAQLCERSWWSGPDIYLVLDDYDLVATSSGNPLLGLLEYLPYAGDLGLHVIVSRRSGGAARALFEPLLAELRDLGCMGLMMSGRPEDGILLGSRPPAALPPGRGLLTTRDGAEHLVQVAWSPDP